MALKIHVLKLLENANGGSLSGEALAKTLGVSRAAVWKAIESLRKNGCLIDAKPGKGYSLASDNNFLSRESILHFLAKEHNWTDNFLGRDNILIYDSIDSTNTAASRLLSQNTISSDPKSLERITAEKMFAGPPLSNSGILSVVIAGEQTAGKGRMRRSFFSPKDTGLYISLVIKPDFDISKSILVTAMAAVAVSNSIRKIAGKKSSIKWVNDIFIDDKKVCGILTEGITNFETGQIDHLIIGIGINCFTSSFDPASGDVAGSISDSLFSRNNLAGEIIFQISSFLGDMESRSFMKDYKKRSLVLGKNILIVNENKTALVLDIDSNGGLVVSYASGETKVINSGEISIRLAE